MKVVTQNCHKWSSIYHYSAANGVHIIINYMYDSSTWQHHIEWGWHVTLMGYVNIATWYWRATSIPNGWMPHGRDKKTKQIIYSHRR